MKRVVLKGRERSKRGTVSEYLGRINEKCLVERNDRKIFEFGSSNLLRAMVWVLFPGL